jgi:hypothetical protein
VGDDDDRCARHAVCAADACDAYVHVREDGAPSAFCGRHYCRWPPLPVCASQARPGGSYCGEHKCIRADCAKERTAAEAAIFCKKHECDADGCFESRMESADHCFNHRCARRPCTAAVYVLGDRFKPPAATNQPLELGAAEYCRAHLPCPRPNCTRLRDAGSGGDDSPPKPGCAKHMTPECATDGCGKKAVDDLSLCDDHLCQRRGCPLARAADADGTRHCVVHKCAVPKCAAGRPTSDRPYCETHACSKSSSCKALAAPLRTTCPEHSKCLHHKCDRAALPSPDADADGRLEFCADHAAARLSLSTKIKEEKDAEDARTKRAREDVERRDKRARERAERLVRRERRVRRDRRVLDRWGAVCEQVDEEEEERAPACAVFDLGLGF